MLQLGRLGELGLGLPMLPLQLLLPLLVFLLPFLLLLLPLQLLLRLGVKLQVGQLLGWLQLQVGPPRLGLGLELGRHCLLQLGLGAQIKRLQVRVAQSCRAPC